MHRPSGKTTRYHNPRYHSPLPTRTSASSDVACQQHHQSTTRDNDDPRTLPTTRRQYSSTLPRRRNAHRHARRRNKRARHRIRSRDPGDKWTRRVPATRTTVEPGKHLWSILDNWTLRYKLKDEHGSDKGIYEIPETGDSVLVALSPSERSHHRCVPSRGKSWVYNVDCSREVDQDALSDALTHVNKYSDEFP